MLVEEDGDSQEISTCKKILNKTLGGEAKCIEEVKLLEDIYQMNAAKAFERYNEIELGMPGMRLDLFYPDYDKNADGE